MIYLHESPLKFHGHLCTSNCLIDSRWVVKIGDFGLHAFKGGSDEMVDENLDEKKKDAAFTSKLSLCVWEIFIFKEKFS